MKKWILRVLMCAALVGLFCLSANAVTATKQVSLDVTGLESAHNYSDNMSKEWTLSHPGAASISLTFDSRTAFESNYDFLYIYDGTGAQVGKYSGTELAGDTKVVPGDSVRLKLTSDGSQTRWGFKVTAASAMVETVVPDDWKAAVVVGEVEHGTLQVDKTTAAYQETVTVTPVPEEGWQLARMYVNGQAVEGTQFLCPYSDTVTVRALFLPESTSVASGTCGTAVNWILYESGELYIYGSGAMNNYSYTSTSAIYSPWHSNRSSIKTVSVENGVTSIGNFAFNSCNALTSVTIGDSVTNIGNYAFYDCNALTSVTIGDSVTDIDSYAFAYCDGLTAVTIGDSVTGIGSYAFGSCDALTEVHYTGDVPGWCGIGFYDSTSNPLYYADKLYIGGELITDLVISEGVTGIGDYAFVSCDALTSVTIGDSVTSIGSRAFYDCDALTTVTIPDSVTRIGSYAFDNCGALTSVTIPDSVTGIGSSAFNNCYALDHVFYMGDADSWSAISIGNNNSPLTGAKRHYITALSDIVTVTTQACENGAISAPTMTAKGEQLTVTAIPSGGYKVDKVYANGVEQEGVTFTVPGDSQTLTITAEFVLARPGETISVSGSCGTTAYWAMYASGELYIYGGGAMTDYAYNSNSSSVNTPWWSRRGSVKTVIVETGVTGIGSYAFYDCDALTTVTMGDSVTGIGDCAFCNCYGLTAVTIGDSVTGIGNSAFSDCDALTEVVIPDSVTTMGDYAFRYCDALTTVTIGDSVTSIGDCAFYDCDALTTVTIPDSVTSIGSGAFRDCGALTTVTIGDSVTSIGSYAFQYCGGLTAVYYTGDVADWCGISFGNATANPLCCADKLYIGGKPVSDLVIPDSVTGVDEYAFYGYSGLTSAVVGSGVTTIGDYAFAYCDALTAVVIPAATTTIRDDAFSGCNKLSRVFYVGEEAGWYSIAIGADNTALTDAQRSYITKEDLIPVTVEACTNGSVSVSLAVRGAEVTLRAQPDLGYTLSKLTVNGVEQTELTFTVPQNVTELVIAAEFTALRPGQTVIDGGFCGISAVWSLTQGGELIISGTGAMFDYYSSSVPWWAYQENIKSVVITQGVTSIGRYAFCNCYALTTVTIGDSVTSIGNRAFYSCGDLTDVYYTGDVADWCGIYFYDYDSNPLYYADKLYMGGELVTELTIPDSVTEIHDYAFYYCDELTSVVIPDSVTGIGSYAFYYCDELTSVVIPDSVTGIGDYAFGHCYLAWAEFMGDAPAEFGNDVFYWGSSYDGDRSTTAGQFVIHYHSGTSGWTSPKWNGYYAFNGDETDCSTLNEENRNSQNMLFTLNESAKTAIVGNNSEASNNSGYAGGKYGMAIVPDTVSKNGVSYRVIGIGQNAFSGNKTLRGVELGKNITSVDPLAFTGCSNFAAFTVAEGNTYYSVQDGVLYDKNKFYLYVYPGGKEQTEFTVPASVEDIGPHAFSAPNLTRLTVPKTVQSIGECAFSGCSNLQSITLPFIGGSRDSTDGFWYVFTYRYYQMSAQALTHVTITDDTLKPGAFSGCYKLQSITLTGKDTQIPNSCFQECESLRELIFADSANTGAGLEAGQIVLPERITAIGYRAFEDCAALTKVTIPANVTDIGESAFARCTGITEFSVAAGNRNYCSDQWGVLYNKGKTTLINYPSARKWPYYNVAETTKIIESYAFYSCANLVNLYVPKTVNAMYQEAISYCPGMTVCAYRGSTAYTYATTNNISAWPMDNYRLQGLEIYSLPEQMVFKKGEVDLTGLYVAANGGRALQADGYTVSYNKNGTGVQTVTVSYMGQSATFEILVYDESGIVVDFGNLTLPDGTAAFAAAYDAEGKMLFSQEAVVMGGHVQMAIPGQFYTSMKQAKLFVLDGVSFAPVVEATIKEKEDI